MYEPDPTKPSGAAAVVTERFYAELRDIARRAFANERTGHTLQPTAAVHEACIRLMSGSPLPELPRAERLAIAARVLSQVLIDHHRRRGAGKRGGAMLRVELADDLVGGGAGETVELEVVHEVLERLRDLHPRQAEVVTLRVFGGMAMDDVAHAIGVAKRTAEADWTVARAWLRRELGRAFGEEP